MEDIQADTNILLRSAEPAHPTHTQAVNAVKTLLANGDRVCLIPQNLIEFWNVATRPIDKNGFGWTPAKTDVEIMKIFLSYNFTLSPELTSGNICGCSPTDFLKSSNKSFALILLPIFISDSGLDHDECLAR